MQNENESNDDDDEPGKPISNMSVGGKCVHLPAEFWENDEAVKLKGKLEIVGWDYLCRKLPAKLYNE